MNDSNSTTGSQVTLTSYMIGENIDEKDVKGISTVLELPTEKRTRSSSPNVSTWLKNRARRGCTKKLIYKRIPICTWLPKYNVNTAVADFVAGLTVGLTVIPQGIAYSNVAGLPPQIGK